MHGYVVVDVKGVWTRKSDMKQEKMIFSVFWFVQLLLFLGYGIQRIKVIISLSSWRIIITFYKPLVWFCCCISLYCWFSSGFPTSLTHSSISARTIKSLEYSMLLYVGLCSWHFVLRLTLHLALLPHIVFWAFYSGFNRICVFPSTAA